MLTARIMRHFRIVTDWAEAGYFETDSLRQLRDDVIAAIRAGRLVAICGPVGSGKTMMMNRLQNDISADKDIIVARSLSVDKPRVTLPKRSLPSDLRPLLRLHGIEHFRAPDL